jgi:hypothetical protein
VPARTHTPVSSSVYCPTVPIPVTTQSKECVCGRSLAGTASLNPAGGMDICLLDYVLSGGCLYVGLITRTEEFYRVWCDCEASIMRRPWPSRGCCAKGEKCPAMIVEFLKFCCAIISAVCTFMSLCFGRTSRLARVSVSGNSLKRASERYIACK